MIFRRKQYVCGFSLFMNFTTEFNGDKLLLKGELIVPEMVFECGQCFRFNPCEDYYTGVAHNRILNVRSVTEGLLLFPVCENDFQSIWRNYFDLDLSYTEIEQQLKKDSIFMDAIPYCRGIRLLNQEPFETLISFIISANNNIKRIKKIIESICKKAGKQLDELNYAFPTPEALALLNAEDFRICGAGYRAEYLYQTARKIADGFPLYSAYEMEQNEARKFLQTLMGVGPKVADCILLFAFAKKEAFPKDVWIRRVLSTLYGVSPKSDKELAQFAENTFGKYAGIAQQYLFHYARQTKLQ